MTGSNHVDTHNITSILAIQDAFRYVELQPIPSTLEVKLRPEFSFDETNLRDVVLQLAMQLCLMGNKQLASKLEKLSVSELIDTLFIEFGVLASVAGTDKAQAKSLQKLKKLIHALAILSQVDLKKPEAKRIVNLTKLLARRDNNSKEAKALKIKLAFNHTEEEGKKEGKKLTDLEKLIVQDSQALEPFLNKVSDEEKEKLTQEYAVVSNIEPITGKDTITGKDKRTERKKIKSRINKFSLVISLIVGLGEGLMAAVFASSLLAAWPFVLVLLAVGIPAALCNYFLFRGASFSVLKEIRFKKLSDSPLTRKLKNFSTLFSSAAGLSYGFISFSTALMAFGHLLFGLTMIAALSTPPVALIILAAVVAVVTTIAIATLYDHTIRGLISKFNLEKLKDDFFAFIKLTEFKALTTLSEKCGHVAMVVARIMLRVLFNIPALVLCALVVVPVTLLARNHMATIFKTTFRVSNDLSNKLATVITVVMGAVVNGYFYASSVLLTANLLKKAVAAVLHPIDTFFQIKESCAAFFKQNNQQKTANVFNGAKRAAFFACVTINGSAQGMGIASVVPRGDRELHDAVLFSGGAASSGANGNAGANAMKGVASVVSKPVAISKNPTSFFNSMPRKLVEETEFYGIALKS